MNVISYLHAKASKLYVALAIIAGIGVLMPSTASSQARVSIVFRYLGIRITMVHLTLLQMLH
ncbi:MAG: hypothetical protein IPM69_15310 [Ignavibacteria bacterium]|nr:hypothetical protein [Ignavibacteria bacterium]